MGQYYNVLVKNDDGTRDAYSPQISLYMTKKGWGLEQMNELYEKHHPLDEAGRQTFVPYPDEFYGVSYGPKLLENGLIGSLFVAGIVNLLREKVMRIAWLGDYAGRDEGNKGNEGDEQFPGYDDYETYPSLTEDDYDYIWENDDDYMLAFPQMPNYEDGTRGYLVNLDKGQYIDLGDVPDGEGTFLHPLVALTVIGNGRGGGDYYGTNMDMLGTWALDRIQVVDTEPVGLVPVDAQKVRFENRL